MGGVVHSKILTDADPKHCRFSESKPIKASLILRHEKNVMFHVVCYKTSRYLLTVISIFVKSKN